MFNKYRAKDVILNYTEKYAELKQITNCIENGEPVNDKLLSPKKFLNVYLEATNRCNLSCAFCARENMTRALSSVSYESFCNIVDNLEAGSYISMNGNGEPLINPSIYDMIEYASKKGMFVSVTTNGTALNDKNKKRLAESGVSRVQFSFQSIHKETYESIFKGAKFDKTFRQVLEFIKYVRENKKQIFITVSVVLVEEGKEYRKVSKEFWNKIPIDNYYEGELLSLQSDSKEYQKQHKGEEIKEKYDICANPWISVKVNSDGTVNPCAGDFSSKFVIGNIKEKSLDEILTSDKAIEFRRAVATGDFDYLRDIGYDCENCNAWTEKAEYGMHSFMQKRFPVRLGLVIDEIAGDKPSDMDYLNEVLSKLDNKTFSIDEV